MIKVAQLFTGDQFSALFQQDCQDLERLYGKLQSHPRLAQLAVTGVSLVSAKAGDFWEIRRTLVCSDGALLGTFPVGSSPNGIAFDGVNIWVANNRSNNVTKLRASDGALLGTFATGNSPARMAFDGANIWVANVLDNTVSKL